MKYIKYLFIVSLICFTLTACGNEIPIDNNGNNDGAETDNEGIETGKYKVEKSGNSVLIKTNEGSVFTVTDYKFSGDSIESITMTQKYAYNDLASIAYNALLQETTIMEQYVDVKLSGNTIILKFNDDLKASYSGISQEEFYNLMYDTYKTYIEN